MDGTEGQAWLEVAQLHASLFPESTLAVERVADGYAVFPRAGSVHMHVLAIGLTQSVTEPNIEEIESFYWSRGVPAQIELCPLVDHSFVRLLGERGYRVTDYSNVLYKPLDVQQSVVPPPSNSGLSVVRTEHAEAELWADTVAKGFADAEGVTRSDRDCLVTLFHLPKTTCFLASIGGAVAGGGAVYINGQLAMLLRSSTLVEHRNRGVHTALLRTRLAFAKSNGCDVAMAVAEADRQETQHNAVTQGFQVAYTRSTLARKQDAGT